MDLDGHISCNEATVVFSQRDLIEIYCELVELARFFEVFHARFFEGKLIYVLNLIFVETFAVNDSHVCSFLGLKEILLGNTDIDSHLEARLLLAFFVKQKFDLVDSMPFLVINIEMIKIIHFVNFGHVCGDQQALADILLIKHKIIDILFLGQRWIIFEYLLDVNEITV